MSRAQGNPRIRLDDETIALLQDVAVFGGQPLRVGGQEFDPVAYVAHGYKGVVWQVSDMYGARFAAKIATADDFVDRSIHDEVARRRHLPPPVFVRCTAAGTWTAPALGQQFVVTVEEWVQDGRTLHDLLNDPDVRVTGSLILAFVHQMCDALDALKAAGLAHDDLHDKNVMIRPTRPGEHGHHRSGRQVVVVDTGSLKPAAATAKDIDDVGYLAHHLVALHNRLHRSRECSPADRRFLACLRRLVEAMLDDGRALRTGEDIRREIEEAWTQAQQPPEVDSNLRTPFEYISAEHIARDDLLLKLFAEAPWFSAVAGNVPILLTGPRGCGKSTLFRYLALKTHAGRLDTPVPYDVLNNTGVYISCTSDLQNRFGWIRTPEQAQSSAPDIVHYFNLLLARETLQTCISVTRREDSVAAFGLGPAQQEAVLAFFQRRLPVPAGVLRGVAPLQQALDLVEQELFVCHRRMLRDERTPEPTGEMFLADLTGRLMELLPFLVKHPIAFLLDDFSTHRVHEDVQRLLTPIVYNRRASYIFKVSSEKHGTVRAQDGGGTADPSREMVEVDCGKMFLDPVNEAKTKEFAIELLRNRLLAAGWQGTPEQLIGEGPRDLAKRLARGERAEYYGLNVIRDLCSGDVSTLLLVYRHVLAHCDATTTATVPSRTQNDAIRAVSRLLLDAIQHHRPHGKEMITIANEFGAFVAARLKGPWGKDGKDGERPVQMPRIEVSEGSSIDLSETADSIRHELLRRAVFIELDPGNSMKSRTTSLRWDFRRVYLPAFGAALKKNQPLIVSGEAFAWFLSSPKQMLDSKLASARGGHGRPGQAGAEDAPGALW